MPAITKAAAPVLGFGLNKLFGGGGGAPAPATPSSNVSAQTDLAKLITQMGKDHATLTGPAYKQAQDYYTSLLGGNRAASAQAVAPDFRAITDLYGGAMHRADRTLTGAGRDQAQGTLLREQTAHLADLIPRARQDAASKLYAGADPTRAAGLFGQAGAAYANANSSANDDARIAAAKREEDRKRGDDFAKLIGSIDWTAFGKKAGKSTSATSMYGGPGTGAPR